MDEFLDFVSVILGVDKESISMETQYGTIPEWDSMSHLRLVAEIEDKYDVSIPFDRVWQIRSLSQFYDYVKGKES
jgi:acyl carrier protein